VRCSSPTIALAIAGWSAGGAHRVGRAACRQSWCRPRTHKTHRRGAGSCARCAHSCLQPSRAPPEGESESRVFRTGAGVWTAHTSARSHRRRRCASLVDYRQSVQRPTCARRSSRSVRAGVARLRRGWSARRLHRCSSSGGIRSTARLIALRLLTTSLMGMARHRSRTSRLRRRSCHRASTIIQPWAVRPVASL